MMMPAVRWSPAPGKAVKRGDVLAVILPNRVELVVAMFAAWRLGGAITPGIEISLEVLNREGVVQRLREVGLEPETFESAPGRVSVAARIPGEVAEDAGDGRERGGDHGGIGVLHEQRGGDDEGDAS